MSATLTQVSGLVLSKLPSKKGDRFILKQANGEEVKVVTFEEFDNEKFLGQHITFGGLWNDTFKNYQVKGAIALSAGSVPAEAPAATPSTPAKKTKASKPALQESSTGVDLEGVRNEAEKIIKADVSFATKLLGKSATSEAIATLVQGLQAVRATLFIEANKRNRVANFQR